MSRRTVLRLIQLGNYEVDRSGFIRVFPFDYVLQNLPRYVIGSCGNLGDVYAGGGEFVQIDEQVRLFAPFAYGQLVRDMRVGDSALFRRWNEKARRDLLEHELACERDMASEELACAEF